MKKIRALSAGVAMVLLPMGLSGCTATMALNGLNGAGACPVETFRIAQQNVHALAYLPEGATQADLETMLSGPEQAEKITLRNGTVRIAQLYRTGHPRCRDLGGEGEFTPVITSSEGEVLGIGHKAYMELLRHASSRTVHDFTPSQPFSLTRLLLF